MNKILGMFKHVIPLGTIKHCYSSTKTENKRNIAYLKGGFRTFWKSSKNIRDKNKVTAENAPDLDNFDSMLQHWQLSRADIPKVKRGILTEIASYLFLIVLLFFGLTTTDALFIYLQLCLTILALGFVVLARFWKYWVLETEKMVLFKDWLTLNY